MKTFPKLKFALHKTQIFFLAIGIASLPLVQSLDAAPRNILISLDGATPRFLEQYLTNGVLNTNQGLGLLKQKGLYARQNITVSPSLTAAGHVAIATGSSAARNDVVANSFQLLASPFGTTISGFGAPIGGYDIHGPAESSAPTAEPLWLALRAAGKKVVAATFPGADGVNVTIPGLAGSPIVQPASERTVDYTIPFGAFAGVGAQGFSLTAADFSNAPGSVGLQLTNAGKVSFSEIKIKSTALETLVAGGVTNVIQLLALDTSNDAITNYDTLVFYSTNQGILPGPFSLPSTGPAYVKEGGTNSAPFYLEGTSTKAGLRYYATKLAPDLSLIRIARSGANSIPRNAPVLADVDDANSTVGFWAPQSDFRIPERLSPGFTTFPDIELEAIYMNLVETFTDYQLRLALRAMQKTNSDLAMIYFEQPDGSSHQFLLIDPRQPSDFTNANSIGAGQDAAKVARYAGYLERAYQVVNGAVQRIIDEVGVDGGGRPNANIMVTSDHGFEAFHTAVNMNNILTQAGFTNTQVRAISSGPAVNIYINLAGRHTYGIVSKAQYLVLQQQVIATLQNAVDTNLTYTLGSNSVPVFHRIYARPVTTDTNSPDFGLETSEFIGQDSGDIYALLTPGYNFDGTQVPVVIRQGDPVLAVPILSLPNFYGAHGYDPTLTNMSAIFLAAGPNIGTGTINLAHNVDIAPTIEKILGVNPAATVQGSALLLASLGLNSGGTLPNGVSSGDVTSNSIVLWTRSLAPGNVSFQISTNPAMTNILVTLNSTVTDTNLPVKVKAANLQPNTIYYFTVTDAATTTFSGRFKTATAPGLKTGLRFGVSGDWRGDLAPFPAVANAAERDLDFFVKLGDTIYADHPSPALTNAHAITLSEFRLKHDEAYGTRLGANTFADLQATTPIFSMIDDHEVINDFAGGAPTSSDLRFDQTGTNLNDTLLFQNGLQAFYEYNAIEQTNYNTPGMPLTDGKPNLYRHRKFGSDAALFLLDARSFRDTELPPATTLNPADISAFLARSFNLNPTNGQPLPPRTMLGAPQLAQLKSDLLSAHTNGVTWKFIAVPEPIQNLGALAASDRFEGYAAERTELLHFIRTNNIRNVVFISADLHGTLVNNLTYQMGPGQPQIASDMFEIIAGAVAYDAPLGPSILSLAESVLVAPGTNLLQVFLAGLGIPNRATFEAALTRTQKDAAVTGLINSQVASLGYDTIGLANSPVPATLLSGAYQSLYTYGWTEFEINPTSQALTVTTYGIDYYATSQVTTEILSRVPAIVSQFTVPASGSNVLVIPTITAKLAGNQVELTWPASAFEFVLQSTANLAAPASWGDEPSLPELASDKLRVRLSLTGNKFFRLVKKN